MKRQSHNTPVEELRRTAVEASPRLCDAAAYYWYFTDPPAELAGRFGVVRI
jgi:hypothetical protein